MKKDKEWLKKELKKCLATSLNRDNHYSHGNRDAYSIALSYVDELDELDEPEQTDTNVGLLKPIIPKFVADWIDTHNLYGNNPLREYRDLENDFNEGWTDEEDAAVYHWVNKNPYAFIDALRYGCEVEKEKLYRVRAGNRHVRFNLDGSIICVKKDNSIVCLERLSKLPFDYEKAVESGIITLEEVTE